MIIVIRFMDYVKKYKKIVDELVNKSFPELKGKWIVFLNFILCKRYVAQVMDFSLIKLIFLNHEKFKDLCFSRKELAGLFAHELCHFVIYSQKNLFQKLVFILFVSFSKKMSNANEREKDLLVIRKGYGEELLKLALKREKAYSKEKLSRIYNAGYLSPNKIRSYMKKVKK